MEDQWWEPVQHVFVILLRMFKKCDGEVERKISYQVGGGLDI